MARQRNKGGWLSSLLGRREEEPPGTRYELAVLDGADRGSIHRLDRPQTQIGRRIPGAPGQGIELDDRSVSARHALIGFEDGQVVIEHLPSATNPTLVNGRRVKRKQLHDGDRIALGLVVLELRAIRPTPRPGGDPAKPGRVQTEPVGVPGELVLREGIDGLVGARFPLIRRRTSIGRDPDCDVVLGIAAVSRRHAALVWEGTQLFLIHESAVNPSDVNGTPVRNRCRVYDGDRIRLSERVVFELQLEKVETAGDAEATRLTSALPVPDAAATRLTSPPGALRTVGDAEETRLEAAPAPAETRGDHPAATRVFEQAEEEEEADFRDGDATRITRVPFPAGARGDPEATRIAPSPVPATPPPKPRPVPEAERTRVVDLDAVLREETGDADRTVIRPAPGPPTIREPLGETLLERPRARADDPEATIVRAPEPGPPTEAPPEAPPRKAPVSHAAETVIIEGALDQDPDEEEEEDDRPA